tara:strand:- start:12 stop:341 length:330 start_codon:yes stop_codon:yes gene_type:complete
MSASSRLYYQIFECAREDSDEIKDRYYDSLYLSKTKERWESTLGKCLILIYQAFLEQSATDETAFMLFQESQFFAVNCIEKNEDPTLERAYQSIGYEMNIIVETTKLPF